MGLLVTLSAWVGLSLVATPFIGRLVAQYAHEAHPRSPRGRAAFKGRPLFHVTTTSRRGHPQSGGLRPVRSYKARKQITSRHYR